MNGKDDKSQVGFIEAFYYKYKIYFWDNYQFKYKYGALYRIADLAGLHFFL